MSDYGYSKQLNIPFRQAVEKTIAGLQGEGFGILTDIDVKKTLQEKLAVEFKQYRILGACHPPRALLALQSEPEIGLLMPCNVIVYEEGDGVVVSALKPSLAFSIVDNEELAPLAAEVEAIFKKVIDNL